MERGLVGHWGGKKVCNVIKRTKKRSDEPADCRHEKKMANNRKHRTLRSDEPTAFFFLNTHTNTHASTSKDAYTQTNQLTNLPANHSPCAPPPEKRHAYDFMWVQKRSYFITGVVKCMSSGHVVRHQFTVTMQHRALIVNLLATLHRSLHGVRHTSIEIRITSYESLRATLERPHEVSQTSVHGRPSSRPEIRCAHIEDANRRNHIPVPLNSDLLCKRHTRGSNHNQGLRFAEPPTYFLVFGPHSIGARVAAEPEAKTAPA